MSIPSHATVLPSPLIAAELSPGPAFDVPAWLPVPGRVVGHRGPAGTGWGIAPSEACVWLTSVVVSESRSRTATWATGVDATRAAHPVVRFGAADDGERHLAAVGAERHAVGGRGAAAGAARRRSSRA